MYYRCSHSSSIKYFFDAGAVGRVGGLLVVPPAPGDAEAAGTHVDDGAAGARLAPAPRAVGLLLLVPVDAAVDRRVIAPAPVDVRYSVAVVVEAFGVLEV